MRRNTFKNTGKPLPRRFVAGLLTAILVATILSPLASFDMRLASIAPPAATCAGDCDACGCSPERRALHTCCCQTGPQQCVRSNERQMARCCPKHDGKRIPAISRICGCGTGKQLVLWEKEEFPVPECVVSEGTVFFREGKHAHDAPERLVSRNVEPPVPPPESSLRL